MKIIYMGTPQFAVPPLRALRHAGHDIIAVVTRTDKPAGRGKVLTPPPVKTAALDLGVPVQQQKRVRAAFVQDMGRTSWEKPEGAWIDARTAVYVIEGRLRGAMGPTLASFAREEDAKAFAAKNGGRVLRFAEVTPEMVMLDGGVLRDRHM